MARKKISVGKKIDMSKTSSFVSKEALSNGKSHEGREAASTPVLPPCLRTVYPTLTKSEKRLAEFVAQALDDLASLTVGEVAKQTAVSEITVARFCKKLGLSGLQELKLKLVSERELTKNLLEYEAITLNDSYEDIAKKIVDNITLSLQDTLNILQPAKVEAAVTLLNGARSIQIYGYGNSATVCKDFESRFMRFGIPIRYYDDFHLQVTAASLASSEDVVVAVSHTGETKELLESLQVVKERGAAIIVITSHIQSSVAQLADVVLCGMGREIMYRSEASASRFAHFAIIDMLYTGMSLLDLQRYEKNLQAMRRVIKKRRYRDS